MHAESILSVIQMQLAQPLAHNIIADILVNWEEELYEVDESIGQVHICIDAFGPRDNNIPVMSITTRDGTASGGTQGDFNPKPSPDQFSFTSVNLSRMCTNIAIVNDNHLENTTETFFVDLSFACGGPDSRAIVLPTTEVTIQDNDGRCCLVFRYTYCVNIILLPLPLFRNHNWIFGP